MKVRLNARGNYEEWRKAARAALTRGLAPNFVDWVVDTETYDLFGEAASIGDAADYEASVGSASTPANPRAQAVSTPAASVSSAFIELTEMAICHSDAKRFDLCYRLLWRLQSQKHLLDDPADPDVRALHGLVKSVRRDMHKMKAFVRFKETQAVSERRAFVAWFEPEHFIVAQTAPFFQRRFGDMDWIIATPKGSAAWMGARLYLCEEPAKPFELKDEADDLWRTYYANIFNPARLKVSAMQSEMPKKYWKNLPEAALIPELIRNADRRVRQMHERASSAEAPAFHRALKSRMTDRSQ